MIGLGLSATALAVRHRAAISDNSAYAHNGVTPKLVWDFGQTFMSHDLATFSRSGLASFTDENGRLQIAADNEPRYDHGIDGRVLLMEDEGVNLCDAPTVPALDGNVYATGNGVLSVVDSTTELAVIGLDHISNGLVYRVDNSAGSQYCFCVLQGAAQDAVTHIGSAYARLVSGPGGQNTIRIDGAAGQQSAYVSSNAFTLYETQASTPGNSQRMLLRIEAGNVIEFVLPFYRPTTQMGAYVPNVGGSAATRAADQLTITGTSYGLAADQEMRLEQASGTSYSSLSGGTLNLGAGRYGLIHDWYT